MVSCVVVGAEVTVDAFSDISLIVVEDSVMAGDKELAYGIILVRIMALMVVLVVVAVSANFKYYYVVKNNNFQSK